MGRGMFTSVIATGPAASSARPTTIAPIARALALAGVAALAFAAEDIERAVAATTRAGVDSAIEADADCLERYRWKPRFLKEKCATPATGTADEPVGAAVPGPDGGAAAAADQTSVGGIVFTAVTLEDGTTAVNLECPKCTYSRWQPEKQRECVEKYPSSITIESLTGAKVTLDQCNVCTTIYRDGTDWKLTDPGLCPGWARDSFEELDELVGAPDPDPDPPGAGSSDDHDQPDPDPPDPPEVDPPKKKIDLEIVD